jgi:hypothetical protein
VRWNGLSHLFGGLEIDGQFELHGLFHRQGDGLGALKNAIDIDRHAGRASPERLLLYLKQPNAKAHLRPKAGATQERTLEAVRCKPLLGKG